MRRYRRSCVTALVAVVAALLVACGGSAGDDDDAASTEGDAAAPAEGAFPVTIEHAFGETEIPEEPTRVLTWGWGSADAAIALDVVPVAIPFQDYGGDD